MWALAYGSRQVCNWSGEEHKPLIRWFQCVCLFVRETLKATFISHLMVAGQSFFTEADILVCLIDILSSEAVMCEFLYHAIGRFTMREVWINNDRHFIWAGITPLMSTSVFGFERLDKASAEMWISPAVMKSQFNTALKWAHKMAQVSFPTILCSLDSDSEIDWRLLMIRLLIAWHLRCLSDVFLHRWIFSS